MREKGLLLSLANEFRVELGSERSFKVFKGIIQTNRFLLSVPAGAVPRERFSRSAGGSAGPTLFGRPSAKPPGREVHPFWVRG